MFVHGTIVCLSTLLIALSGTQARAEYVISAYGGYNFSFDGDVDVANGPSTRHYDVEWDGKSFEKGAPFYGVRGTWWLNDFGKPDLGVAIDFSHAKVAAEPLPAGVEVLEFTDGLNLLTLNALYRFETGGRLTPYVGAGAGISIPHVEYRETGGPETFEYQVTGPAIQGLAGVDVAVTDSLSVFGEYKLSYTSNDADLVNGGSLKTDIFTNQLIVGASFKFGQ
ncbi:outer membrane beta-barrel protein [Fulvimarina sp. 2208YS6-2-32]|uniref:Outer membrane beta-barrel protein n=1 Tax=Fulvimarina uroteuthidis TaxID=3098149 RepID=A0ABU5I3P8_9HYPH|nr:outer membrane beta-barrel protein [Fulvimarina sp. 2208YS6-2-32]MDY8109722.1 outer membrane beta-barrel protein [Fulvimarina sp. 2208YS6-2-32]